MQLLEPVSERSRIVAAEGIGLVTEGDRAWLDNTATDERIELSPAAAVLWERFDGIRPLGDIAEELGYPLIEVVELVRRLRANDLAGDAGPGDAPS